MPETYYAKLQHTLDRVHTGDKITLQSSDYTDRLEVRTGVELVGQGVSSTTLSGGVRITGEVGYVKITSVKIKSSTSGKGIISMDDANGRCDSLHLQTVTIDGNNADVKAIFADAGMFMGDIHIEAVTFEKLANALHIAYFGWNEANYNTGKGHLKTVVFKDNIVKTSKGAIGFRGASAHNLHISSVSVTGNTINGWAGGTAIDAAMIIGNAKVVTFSTNTIADVPVKGAVGLGCAVMMYCTSAW
jgi:hypothetical protein